jgi:energy-coupling factor transport system permease protein
MLTATPVVSPLRRFNPTAKLVALGSLAAGATLSFDPFIPGMLLAGTWLAAWTLGRIPSRAMLRGSLVLVALSLPMAAFTALYADVDPTRARILARLGPWLLTVEGILLGVGLGLRVAAFVAGSLLFAATTDPTDFALSLIQNGGLPYRFGYGLLISYRFLPTFREEFETIRMAHRVRGIGRRGGWRGRWEEFGRLAIPLLAAAIRRSERAALAMDARGFGAVPSRTYYRRMRIRAADAAGALAAAAFVVGVYAVALRWGLARLEWIPGA